MKEWIFLKAQNMIVESKEVELLTWEIILLNVIVWTIMKREVIRNGNNGITKLGSFLDKVHIDINLDSNIWKGENGTRWILQIQSYLKISHLWNLMD